VAVEDHRSGEGAMFLALVRAHAGNAGLARVLAYRGGSRIYLSGRLGPGHWLCRLLGLAAARAILTEFEVIGRDGITSCGFEIELPTHAVRRSEERKQVILHLLRKGLPTSEIASRLGLTERAIRLRRAAAIRAGTLPAGDTGKSRPPQGGGARDWPNERLALLADGATDEDVRIAEEFGLSLRTVIGLRARFTTPRDPRGLALGEAR